MPTIDKINKQFTLQSIPLNAKGKNYYKHNSYAYMCHNSSMLMPYI